MPTVPIKMCISSFADDVELKHDWTRNWWLTPMQHDPYVVGSCYCQREGLDWTPVSQL